MKIIYNSYVLKDSKERLFPVSRHRSARIHKKLIKRFGGEFRSVPCMYKVGDTIYAHPSFKAEIERLTIPSNPSQPSGLNP